MQILDQKISIKGVIPPMVTPMDTNGEVDIQGVEKLVEHLISGGVHGVFILGTTGEFSSLDIAQKKELIAATCKFVDGRIPVLVGVTDVCLKGSIALSKFAERSGAYAVVAAPPYYMGIDQEELCHFYGQLADSIPLPLFLYNMPSHTKVSIDVQTAVALSKHKNIIGLKDSSANGSYFQSLRYYFNDQPDFVLMVGPEEMLAETVLMGGYGGVCGGANLFPRLYVKLYQAAMAHDIDEIIRLQKLVMTISQNIYRHGGYKSSYLKGLKTALSFSGIIQAQFAPPLFPFAPNEEEELKARFSKIASMIIE
ncbi:dihydrodipicolinate synthase family protein [Echinicola vietnamensis]|uniref:Dihydrodipicolinate synthase/N-acetylneuraminate lyase n=1 Tax=Echinicola vietnamensis (strain DSM 17526 / LMG 23754 / KMM 6221) TaxID=926556 RepID=L0G387_ECHVK|nr:dihydrodipicolinate synthase family protein [Echinicola vietnamensis]AGA80689.1 dihydrodipicolinate synthase/N-acetylneuraminate lyase [Echinicola vietnamensis DSM 17526]